MENILRTIEGTILIKYTEKNNLNHILKKIESDLYKEISKKADFDVIKNLLEGKVDVIAMTNHLLMKVSQKDYENIKIQTDNLLKEVKSKLGNDLFNKYVNEMRSSHEEMQKDLLLKANFNEILLVLKNKADIEEVNKALKQLHSKLDIKTDIEQVFFF